MLAVKMDEDLPESLAAEAVASGYDVATVRSQGWSGMKDPQLWALLQREQRFFIAADKEFGDLRKFPPGTHAGILLLRPQRESAVDYSDLLREVLERHRFERMAGCVSVATRGGLRIRRPST